MRVNGKNEIGWRNFNHFVLKLIIKGDDTEQQLETETD